MKVLMITSEWPTAEHPEWAPFIVQQVEFLRREGIEVDVFAFRGAKKPWNYWRARRAVQQKLHRKKYDVIHAQFGQSGLLAIPSKIPLVTTFRGSDVLGIIGKKGNYTLLGFILTATSRLVEKFADEVILVSKSLGIRLTRHQYFIIPSGINFELFRPLSKKKARKILGLPLQKKIILFGASPNIPRKRYFLAKKAVNLINKFFDPLLITLGSINHSQIPLYLNAADVLLLTSKHEGSPNIIKEALACNTPIVSTDVGDVRERIGNIDGCEVCGDDRPETIAAALERVLARGDRIKGRQTVLDLDERLVAKRVIEVYQKAIEKKTRSNQL